MKSETSRKFHAIKVEKNKILKSTLTQVSLIFFTITLNDLKGFASQIQTSSNLHTNSNICKKFLQ